MANRDNPHGFIPRYSKNGEIRGEQVQLAAANSAIGVGSPLALTSAGVFDLWSSGAIAGFAAQAAAANFGGTILAYTDKSIVYSAQMDDTTGIGTVQDGMTLNYTIIGATGVSNGHSTAEIDESSGATTDTLPLKAIGLYKSPDNAFGQFNEILVQINNSSRGDGTGTLGV